MVSTQGSGDRQRGSVPSPSELARKLRESFGTDRGVERAAEVQSMESAVLRGTAIEDPRSVTAFYAWVAKEDPYHIKLLSQCVPHKSGYEHIAVFGSTGSGKTTCINQIQQDCLWHVGRGYGHRVFIWDFKRTARRYLASLPLNVPVYILDPADSRSDGIDWPRQLRTDFAAKQFAKQVVHPQAEQGGNNYAFTANARSILYHVIRTFIKFAKGQWDLTDVVEACSTEANLARVLSRTPKGKAKLKTVLGAKGQRAGVFFSLEEFASDFGPIAAAFAKVPPERRITLSDWLDNEAVLVVSHYDEYEEALAPFQRWVFGAVQRQLLSRPDIPHDSTQRTTFFLDEVRNAPFVGREVSKLLNSGRSKGAMVVTGLGDVSGLMDAVGDKKAEEYLGMCKTKVFLRCEGKTVDWVCNLFGKQLRMIHKLTEGESVASAFGLSEQWTASPVNQNPNRTFGASSNWTVTRSDSVSHEATERPVLYHGDLIGIPAPRFERGVDGEDLGLLVRGFMSVEGLLWPETATHMDKASVRIDEKVKDIEPRPNEDMNCDDIEWGEEDFIRLGLVDEPQEKKAAERTQTEFEAMMGESVHEDSEDDQDDEDNGQEESILFWFDEGDFDGFDAQDI